MSATGNGVYPTITREQVEAARQEALRLRHEASEAWSLFVNLAGDRNQQLENWPTTCPVGCDVRLPRWADRAKWGHMDAYHVDAYDPAIKGGYELDWPRVAAPNNPIPGHSTFSAALPDEKTR